MPKKKDTTNMRSYKALPEDVGTRIQFLTPKTINDFPVETQVIDDPSCLLKPEDDSKKKTHRITYVNMECSFTKNIRGFPVVLRSAPKIVEPSLKAVLTESEYKAEIKNAESFGWSKSDLFYESIVDCLVKKDAEQYSYMGESRPEIYFASDTICILVSEYNKSQFVGWFFYNKNTDRLLSFTSYQV